jgi:pyridoxine 5-phosphate synthase
MSRPCATRAAALVPDPVRAALLAIEAGADGITAHLREDRRTSTTTTCGGSRRRSASRSISRWPRPRQMLDIALRIRPHACCLVPEKRTERTTEGGLDVVGGFTALRPFVAELARAGIRVSMFIEPSPEALKAARTRKAPVVELHTGRLVRRGWRGDSAKADHEFGRLRVAAAETAALGLECHAGHGLDYETARLIAALPQIVELNIGHFLIGEAIFVGLAEAVKAMPMAMAEGRDRRAPRGDHRHRQRPLRHPAHREDAGALRRAFHRPLLHPDRAAPLRPV